MKPEASKVVEVLFDTAVSKNLIAGTWLPSLYYGNDWLKEVEKDLFFSKYLEVIVRLMGRDTVYFNAAVLKRDPDTIVSYAVLEPNKTGTTLHFVYTKPDWRKKGIGGDLIPTDLNEVTHLTKIGRAIKPKSVIYNPFL